MIKGTISLQNDVSVDIETSDVSQFLEVLRFVQGADTTTPKNIGVGVPRAKGNYGHPGFKNWSPAEIATVLEFLNTYRGTITGRATACCAALEAASQDGKTVRTVKGVIQLLNAIDHYRRNGDTRYLSSSVVRIIERSGSNVRLHRDFGSMRTEASHSGGRVHSLIDNFNEA